MSEHLEKTLMEFCELESTGNGQPSPERTEAGANDSNLNRESASLPKPAPVDPFDPMNLGISTDYAAAINAKASTKPFELRAPNDQEFFRTSPRENHHLVVGSIADKQDMGKVYIVSGVLLEEVKLKFPKAVRAVKLVLAQTLAGTSLVWPVPLAEDRGGKWNSTQRAACDQGKTRWTNKTSGRGEYDIVTVNNPKEVDWDFFPPFRDILRQAASEHLIDSLEHPLLKKLRGEIE
jgi:hypothetical protein